MNIQTLHFLHQPEKQAELFTRMLKIAYKMFTLLPVNENTHTQTQLYTEGMTQQDT